MLTIKAKVDLEQGIEICSDNKERKAMQQYLATVHGRQSQNTEIKKLVLSVLDENVQLG